MEARIAELLKQFNFRCNDIFFKRTREAGITPPQLMVLQYVYPEPRTIGQIVEVVQLSYSTVSGVIDRLERDGWIERVRDEKDRRIIWIRKTDKLNERARVNMSFREKFYTDLLDGLSENEKEMILKSVELLVEQIEKKVEEKP